MICIGSPEARIMGACKLYSMGAGMQAKAPLGEKEALLTLSRHFSPSFLWECFDGSHSDCGSLIRSVVLEFY